MKSLKNLSNMGIDEKYAVFGARLACHIQRMYRGQCGRVSAKLERWQKYQTCAFVIQRAYREHVEWQEIITHTVLRRLQQASQHTMSAKAGSSSNSGNGKRADSPKTARKRGHPEKKNGIQKPTYATPQPSTQPTSANFTLCLRNMATFDEKMSVWRALVELRRGHRDMSPHICLKAMIEANGDLSRAMVLMGDQTYHLKNEGDVPRHLRQIFMPFLWEEDYLPKKSHGGSSNGGAGSPDQRREFEESFNNGGSSIGLDGIRKLRAEQTGAAGGGMGYFQPGVEEGDDDSGGLNVADVIAHSYFSKYFAGNTKAQDVAPCLRANKAYDVPSIKPINAEERHREKDAKRKSKQLSRATSPIIVPGSHGRDAVGARSPLRGTFRGDARSPSPTNKFGQTFGAKFGGGVSGGRPGKLKRRMRGVPISPSKGQGRGKTSASAHANGMAFGDENHYNRQQADAALLTSLIALQDEMDSTGRH